MVKSHADAGQEHLERMLDTDEGARFLGEVAFGLNDEIQIATGETLFDEKIGGTCHVALGMAFPEAGGTNPSGIHWDIVCDLRDGLTGLWRRPADLRERPVSVSDPRVRRLAELIAEYSVDVGEGDLVMIHGPSLAEPLLAELTGAVSTAGGSRTCASRSRASTTHF